MLNIANAEADPKAVWTKQEKEWLLCEYTAFESEVGPNRIFRTKKELYKYLSQQISFLFGEPKTEQQILNRVQTIMRQRKSTGNAGLSREQVPVTDLHRNTGVVKPVQWSVGVVRPCKSVMPSCSQSVTPIPEEGAAATSDQFSEAAMASYNIELSNTTEGADSWSNQSGTSDIHGCQGTKSEPEIDLTDESEETAYSYSDATSHLPSPREDSGPVDSGTGTPIDLSSDRPLGDDEQASVQDDCDTTSMEAVTGQAYHEIWVGEEPSDIWTVEESKYVLDFYDQNINDVGPMKKFRNKKEMWEELAIALHSALDCKKTASQISRRFDALMKKKKIAVTKNKTSGSTRTRIEFQEELDKIAANDDSIEPEVIRGVNSVKYKELSKGASAKKPKWDKPTKKGIMDNLSETLMAIEKRKLERETEKNRQRDERHKATMELLAALIRKNDTK